MACCSGVTHGRHLLLMCMCESVSVRAYFSFTLSHRLMFVSTGIREAMLDGMLSRYDAVILDEAHERTIHTDVLFALLKGTSRTHTSTWQHKFLTQPITGLYHMVSVDVLVHT